MPTRRQVLHAWTRQMRTLLPAVHATRAATLALFAAGILWSGTVTLLKVAAALPLTATDPSIERRLRRFLANPHVTAAACGRRCCPPCWPAWASATCSSSSIRPLTGTEPRFFVWAWSAAAASCPWPGA